MTIEESIKAAMARMIERKEGISVEVTGWEEEYDVYLYSSGCSCADYDKDFTVSVYHIYEGRRGTFNYSGTFAELIKELDTDE